MGVGEAILVELAEVVGVDGPTLLRRILLILDTLGTLNLSQTPSLTSLSLISQAKIPGSFALSSRIKRTT